MGASSLLLSPVFPSQDAENSFNGSKSWLNVKASAGLDSPQTTNWLSTMNVAESAPDTARTSASANWLQAPLADNDLLENTSDTQSEQNFFGQSAARTLSQGRGGRHRASRASTHNGDAPGHVRHRDYSNIDRDYTSGDFLPPALTLPPLPPTPPSVGSKDSARGLNISDTPQTPQPETTQGALGSWTALSTFPAAPAPSDGGRSSGRSATPATPSDDDTDAIPTQNRLEGLSDRLRSMGGARESSNAFLPYAGTKGQRRVKQRHKRAESPQSVAANGNSNDRELLSWPMRAAPADKNAHALAENDVSSNGHSAHEHTHSGNGERAMAASPARPPPPPPVLPRIPDRLRKGDGKDSQAVECVPRLEVASNGHWHTKYDQTTKSSGTSSLNNVSPALNSDSPPRQQSATSAGNGTSTHDTCSSTCSFTPAPALVIREHLMDFRFSCGLIADKDRTAQQKMCYTVYFSSLKRGLVTLVVLFHTALAFAELQTKSYLQHVDTDTGSLRWQSAQTWIQAIHFVCVFVYIADTILMAFAVTSANLNPTRNMRNLSFLVLVILIAADTLLTATNAFTSSYSLPLRGLLLIYQLPGTVRMFSLWLRLLYHSVPILVSIFFVMVCLAVVAVIGIREYCPYRLCVAGTGGAECKDDVSVSATAQCDALLSHCSSFPSALLILWNLSGGAGHVDNLLPFVDASPAFGMLYFVFSSGVCVVWFRFSWLAVTWHSIRSMSRQVALTERRKLMQLLSSTLAPSISAAKHVSLQTLAHIVSSVWPNLSLQQSSKVLQHIYGVDQHQSVLIENTGALAWLLHADSHFGFTLPKWLSRGKQLGRKAADADGAARDQHDDLRQIVKKPKEQECKSFKKSLVSTKKYLAMRLLNLCAILSMVILLVSAWMPDSGVGCILRGSEVSARSSECLVNRVFEWLDVVVCAAFCGELGWLLATQRLSAFTSVYNVYKMLEVTTEVLMIWSLFRDEGMGNKAMILRLLRAPRLLSIIHDSATFIFFLEFAQAEILKTELSFIRTT